MGVDYFVCDGCNEIASDVAYYECHCGALLCEDCYEIEEGSTINDIKECIKCSLNPKKRKIDNDDIINYLCCRCNMKIKDVKKLTLEWVLKKANLKLKK